MQTSFLAKGRNGWRSFHRLAADMCLDDSGLGFLNVIFFLGRVGMRLHAAQRNQQTQGRGNQKSFQEVFLWLENIMSSV
jgi:hypothetical protein